MSTRYKLLFRGQIAADQHPAVVRSRLQAMLKASTAQLDVLFSGKPVSIKKDVDEAAAERYLDAFMKAGAKLEIVELDAEALAESARKAEMVAAAQAHKAQQAKEAQEQEQAQQLEALAQAAAAAIDDDVAEANEPADARPDAAAKPTQGIQFALAEVGSDLVAAAAKKPEPVLSVPTDHLSLAEAGGNLMDATEPAVVVSLPPVDTSHLSLDEAGATLGVPAEVAPLAEALTEFDFELGEVGEILVESVAVEVPEIPNLSHFELESLPDPEPAPEPV